MCHDSPVATLVEEAKRGDESAWGEILQRYLPLVFTICHRHGVVGVDAEEVSGNVWLHLVASLTTIREPAALPGWLVTTTRRECVSLLRAKRRLVPTAEEVPTGQPAPGVDAFLLEEEQRNAVREAFVRLSDHDRALLSMLFSDPPTPYATISSRLGMPIGAIGPNRQRCIARMRRTPEVEALLPERLIKASSDKRRRRRSDRGS